MTTGLPRHVKLLPPALAVLLCATACGPGTALAATPRLVSGLAPSQRPVGAPVVREFQRDADWRARALTGIGPPLPASLAFINTQGAWYTPFNQPGMPGYYDLRHWHQPAASKQEKSATP